jgi:hypothetical protein
MNSNNVIGSQVKQSKNRDGGLINWITQYDSLVVFGGFGILIVLTILYTGLFQAGPIVRTNVLFNAALAILVSVLFIWTIFHFMGAKLNILGKSFDMGMIIYVFIVAFVIFVMGN